jgi:hypothetical protein
MQNELYIASKGHIQAPRIERMDRSDLVEAEEAAMHFQQDLLGQVSRLRKRE